MWVRCDVSLLVSDVNSGDHDLARNHRMLDQQLVLRSKAPALVGARLAILQKLDYSDLPTSARFGLIYSALRLQLNNLGIGLTISLIQLESELYLRNSKTSSNKKLS